MSPRPHAEPPQPAEALDPLLVLARSELSGSALRADAALRPKVMAAWELQRVPWNVRLAHGLRTRRFAMSALASVPLLALAIALWPTAERDALPPLRYELSRSVMRFSDGSTLALAEPDQVRIEAIDAHGASVRLARGNLHVAIHRLPGARWAIAAGPYRVRVTGTEFDVSWSEQSRKLDVRMEHGSVEVTGPHLESPVVLRTGSRLLADMNARRWVVERIAPTIDAPMSPREPTVTAAATQVQTRAAQRSKLALMEPGKHATPEPPTSARGRGPLELLVARGRFAEVVRQAERAGAARTLEREGARELAALADAARYVGKNAWSRRALLTLRKRFPSSDEAADAAFLLGRLAEQGHDRDDALSLYTGYVEQSPHGPYAAQALGRSMLLIRDRDGSRAARSAATEYLARFARGAHRRAARAILAERDATVAPRSESVSP